MNELALFAGAGGGVLGGLICGLRTVAAVEIDGHARSTLLRRQRDGVLPSFPVWDDVRTFNGRPFRGLVDVVSAGFPCQPFSFAGHQKAAADERNGWPDTIRIIREVRPAIALLENVPGLLSRRHGYMGVVLGDLAAAGFDAEWCVLGAADVGAPHRRKRLWILAYSVRHGAREKLEQLRGQAGSAAVGAGRRMRAQSGDGSDHVPHAAPQHRAGHGAASVAGLGRADGADTECQRRPPGRHDHQSDDRDESPSAHPGYVPNAHCIGDSRRAGASGQTAGGPSLAEAEGRSRISNADSCGFARRAECDSPTHGSGVSASSRSDADRCCGAAGSGAESGLGGVADGLACGLDGHWTSEPRDIPRVAAGVNDRVSRLRCIGNGQVPLCAAMAWRLLAGRALSQATRVEGQ